MEGDRIRQGWQTWLGSNYRGWRILVGLVCVFALASFLHFRQARFDVLELNAVASRYVIAQVDFEFPDDEATIVLKQQSMKDIGKIYQIDDKQIREERYALEETLIHGKEWRIAAPGSTFEEMYKAADETETLLLESRFTDPRTIQKIKELSYLDHSHYFEYVPENGDELPLTSFWNALAVRLASENAFNSETIRYVVGSLRSKHWELVEDHALENSIRAQVIRNIPGKMTKIYAGARIL